MIQDILADKIECIVVKDLSRLGRDHIAVGYHLEIFFPKQRVRFVSINDQFDTVDGITNQNKEVTIQSRIRIPYINLFNEQVSIETKIRVKESLDMKSQRGEFIGPRAPFGYQKSRENPDQLIPDPVAAIIVQKIFEMASNGTGVTGIVRYLNERGLPTPIQYARSNGLNGNYDNGDGNWNSCRPRSGCGCRQNSSWLHDCDQRWRSCRPKCWCPRSGPPLSPGRSCPYPRRP